MQDQQFRTLLNLMMEIDPWPLSEDDKFIFMGLMLNESKKRGYDDETQAYHYFLQGNVKKKLPVKQRKPRKARGIKKQNEAPYLIVGGFFMSMVPLVSILYPTYNTPKTSQ